MSNAELKTEIKTAKVPQWRIADELGICEMTLIRWMRHELPQEKKMEIRAIIAKLKEGVEIGK